VTASRFADFAFDSMLAGVTQCKIVKYSDKRQVFYLQAPCGEFFLKRSLLVRSKDRLRHLFFPRRRWAEWRNLHQLQAARIAAAVPVSKGEKKGVHLEGFFLLTRKVDGNPLTYDSLTVAKRLGQYVASLHSRDVYHADLHPGNIIIKSNGQPCLIDAQEVFFLPWLPRRLRVYNLGKLYFHIYSKPHPESWPVEFLGGYNEAGKRHLTLHELLRAADRHQHSHYRSRAKRCCKNSTEFVVVKGKGFQGYKRKDFRWGPQELRQALQKGRIVKHRRVITFKDVCIKIHQRQFFHRDRCLASWKMSRAMEVRGIPVPRSLGYFAIDGNRFFLSEYLANSMTLNDYLSSLTSEQKKRRALKKLASWLKEIHGHHIWQRDFKSSNVLCRNDNYQMVDLDGVKICRHLPEKNRIVNLAQLNASVSNAIAIRDRLRFYYYYTAAERPPRQQRRAIYRKVWAITTGKNTSAYGLDITKLQL